MWGWLILGFTSPNVLEDQEIWGIYGYVGLMFWMAPRFKTRAGTKELSKYQSWRWLKKNVNSQRISTNGSLVVSEDPMIWDPAQLRTGEVVAFDPSPWGPKKGPHGPYCFIIIKPVSWGKNAGKWLDVMSINSLPHLTLRMTLRITRRHAFCVSSSWSCTSGRWRDWRISLDSWRVFSRFKPTSFELVIQLLVYPTGKDQACRKMSGRNKFQLTTDFALYIPYVTCWEDRTTTTFFCGMSSPFTRLLFMCVIVDDRL